MKSEQIRMDAALADVSREQIARERREDAAAWIYVLNYAPPVRWG